MHLSLNQQIMACLRDKIRPALGVPEAGSSTEDVVCIRLIVSGVADLVFVYLHPKHVLRVKGVIRNILDDEFDLRFSGCDFDRGFEHRTSDAPDLAAFLLVSNFALDHVVLDLPLVPVFAQHAVCHAHKKIGELIV